MEETLDPLTHIEERGKTEEGVPYVIYRTFDGERWIIYGTCIACGECEIGNFNPNLIWTGIPVGQPFACIDRNFGLPIRKDVPIRPELVERLPHCTLSGEYLDSEEEL